ncbi:protein arginine N-methyltransferase 3 [Tremella mesenterica]|uniref:type I protein arginine methyltransferase n=1 Tax=Tremella mesenterica TaxID=5217 RepID=A0A4Q1BUK2_TREME|nr:protein arginine N-methyltransferase 3 [Tremella mesenterica]
MTYRLTEETIGLVSTQDDSGSESTDSDERASDWVSSLGEAERTKSLFSDEILDNAKLELVYDLENHGFDLMKEYKRLDLDFYGRMRYVNLIRAEGLNPDQAKSLSSQDPRLKDDAFLHPVIPDDPLLQLDFEDSWSDDDSPDVRSREEIPSGSSLVKERVESDGKGDIERQLVDAEKEIERLQELLRESLVDDDTSDSGESASMTLVRKLGQKGKGKGKERDDDTHYFESYEHNDIHEIMLKDTVRTMSYATFILSNPQVFRGATVMDVGCGTGILSMFAARAGAKKVYGIEASALAGKARENVKKNGFGDIITIIQGKVEETSLPVLKVDIIISEWMGYMLLYESMLDSVLVARDKFLSNTGLMVPSQTRLVISGITAEKVWAERVKFWSSVYGFDMATMSDTYFDEGLTEVVDPEEVMTTESIIKDINSHSATIDSLDFHSSFQIHSTTTEPITLRAFMVHFNTFFSPLSGQASHVSSEHTVDLVKYENTNIAEPIHPPHVDREGKVGTEVSFTTGPKGRETHWKQVVFLLRNSIVLQPGQSIIGQFHCRKSPTNSRELDVEIHFSVSVNGKVSEGSIVTVQSYKVR